MLKPLSQLRQSFDLYPQEISSSVRYFFRNNIDWEVYLPTRDMNLQRGFVWTLEQKRELIYSILIGRHIPHCAVLNIVNPEDQKNDIYQIIDGKQRLSAIKFFLEDEFTIILEGKRYLFSELPDDYKVAIDRFHFRYYVVNEPWDTKVTDEQKISWFNFINFAGTIQDKEHMEKLKNYNNGNTIQN